MTNLPDLLSADLLARVIMPLRYDNYKKCACLKLGLVASVHAAQLFRLLRKISTLKNTVEIIIETPKGSSNKYIWDEEREVVKFKKCMPLGFIFPFDFGMIPGTKAEDGDPVDVLLLMEEPVYPGTFIEVKIIAGLKATQKQASKKGRNDRLIAIEKTCPVYGHYERLQDIGQNLQLQIENFFRSYNEVQHKEFVPLGWADAEEAMQLIKDAAV